MEAINWNEILQKYFIEVMEFVKSSKNFASEQIPLYLKELIVYEIGSNLIWGSFWVAVAIYLIWGIKKYISKIEDSELRMPILALSIIIVFLTVVGSINLYSHALKAYVAPRLVIVEKIQELIDNPGRNH